LPQSPRDREQSKHFSESVDTFSLTSADELVQQELILNRFKRLLAEIERGTVNRNSFLAWEIEILLDMEACALDSRRKSAILHQYEHAVERQMETGPGPPMKLSKFLVRRAQRRAKTTPDE
jgi:hypothetical protein